MLAAYVSGIIFVPRSANKKLINAVFCLTPFVLHVFTMLKVYLDVGATDWNFLNTLPVANVSPFTFCVLPVYFVLPKNIKRYFLTLISLLSVGMILSPLFSCVYFQSIAYKFHPSFFLGYTAHFVLSFWGVYLVKTEQVDLKIKDCLAGGGIIVAVAIIMTILNVIFDTAFFGLSLNGKHNIYNMVLVENSYLSAILYFAGLIGVMVLGYFYQRLFSRTTKKTK